MSNLWQQRDVLIALLKVYNQQHTVTVNVRVWLIWCRDVMHRCQIANWTTVYIFRLLNQSLVNHKYPYQHIMKVQNYFRINIRLRIFHYREPAASSSWVWCHWPPSCVILSLHPMQTMPVIIHNLTSTSTESRMITPMQTLRRLSLRMQR